MGKSWRRRAADVDVGSRFDREKDSHCPGPRITERPGWAESREYLSGENV